jgi:hypothetical protein
VQNFDAALGSHEKVGTTILPAGWFVDVGGTKSSAILESFPTNDTRPGPYNAGESGQSDRALPDGTSSSLVAIGDRRSIEIGSVGGVLWNGTNIH